jgi:predicted metal-dependent hydrolase
MDEKIKIDQLIRSHRRTIGLQITADARLIVRAPFRVAEDHIIKLIRNKASWIRAKQDYFKQRQSAVQIRKFIPGEEFLFLGQRYTLKAVEYLSKAVVLGDSLMISSVVLSNARDHLECWYKERALEHITQRVEFYARQEGLKYQSIKISSAVTRWGSCGYRDTLNFTWRLMMALPRVVDYVVVHELMHLKQKNHSRKFWNEVAKIVPDYKQDERWLKSNNHLLSWDA